MLPVTPPVNRTLEIFTRLPDKFRRKGEVSAWSRVNRLGAAGECFLEGPVCDEHGNLFVTDIEYGRVFRIDGQGNWELLIEYDGEPNGMKFLTDRELIVADYKNGLVVVDIHAGTLRPFLERRNCERFKGLNDLTFDSRGNLYFTDQGQTGLHDPTGRLFRLSASGHLDMLLGNVPSPNGLVLSPDEKVLFLAATRGNCIWRVPLMEDGGVSKVGQYFSMNGPAGPDGLAMDIEGRLLVANPGVGVIWILNKLAQPIEVLQSPVGNMPTNITFGGEQRKMLYCTESETGTILRAGLEVSGCKLHRLTSSS